MYGPDPENGHRFNPNKLLIDPYARELVGDIEWNDAHFGYELGHDELDLSFDTRDSAPFTPKCKVIDPNAVDWQDSRRPDIPWPHTVVYESHVKGFTQLNPAIPPELRGTFEGMGHKASVEYIKSLGITSVELLPVHWFPDDQHLLDRGLKTSGAITRSVSLRQRPAITARRASEVSATWCVPIMTRASR